MSNTTVKHTPGPWMACHDGKCPCGSISTNDLAIATLCGDNEEGAPYVKGEDERMANAKLIAAAPELLEALQNLAKNCIYDGKVYCPNIQQVNDAFAAIKKATS
jgi:hypothetical protein